MAGVPTVQMEKVTLASVPLQQQGPIAKRVSWSHIENINNSIFQEEFFLLSLLYLR